MNNEQIDVSVCMLTYYHEKYLRKAIDSVLMQKTSYRYEIVISDDSSKDGTLEILGEYEKEYPELIRVNRNEHNIGIPQNMYMARCMCKGRYIVHLSGDDYWICDDKIERQARFLDEHPEYIAACVGMELRVDDETKAYDILPKKTETERVFTIKDYEAGTVLYTHGMMLHNFFLNENDREYFKSAQEISDKVDDAVDNVLMLRKGNVYIMDFVTDVYRVPSEKNNSHNYNSRYSSVEKTKNAISLYNNLYQRFGNEISFKKRYIDSFSVTLLRIIIEKNISEYMKIYKTIPLEYRKPSITGVLICSIPGAVGFAVKQIINKIRKLF